MIPPAGIPGESRDKQKLNSCNGTDGMEVQKSDEGRNIKPQPTSEILQNTVRPPSTTTGQLKPTKQFG